MPMPRYKSVPCWQAAVRSLLLQGLVDEEPKVQSAVGLAIAHVASCDWPEEWPELMDHLMAALADTAHPSRELMDHLMAALADTAHPNRVSSLYPPHPRFHPPSSLLPRAPIPHSTPIHPVPPLPLRHSPCTTPPASLPLRHSPCATPPAPFPLRHSPCTTSPAQLPLHHSPCATSPAPLPLRHPPCTTPPAPLPLHHSPCATPPACILQAYRPSARRGALSVLRATVATLGIMSAVYQFKLTRYSPERAESYRGHAGIMSAVYQPCPGVEAISEKATPAYVFSCLVSDSAPPRLPFSPSRFLCRGVQGERKAIGNNSLPMWVAQSISSVTKMHLFPTLPSNPPPISPSPSLLGAQEESKAIISESLPAWVAQFSAILSSPLSQHDPQDWGIRKERLLVAGLPLLPPAAAAGDAGAAGGATGSEAAQTGAGAGGAVEGGGDGGEVYESAADELSALAIQLSWSSCIFSCSFPSCLSLLILYSPLAMYSSHASCVFAALLARLSLCFLSSTPQEEEWQRDTNEFVSEEDDEAISCRTSAAALLEELVAEYKGEAVQGISTVVGDASYSTKLPDPNHTLLTTLPFLSLITAAALLEELVAEFKDEAVQGISTATGD
ncbi:unnamed protein product [Closterium sp. NIES-53]